MAKVVLWLMWILIVVVSWQDIKHGEHIETSVKIFFWGILFFLAIIEAIERKK